MKFSVDFSALQEQSERKNKDREAVEIRIATLVREGLTAPMISIRIGVSESTIRRALRKLRASLPR